MIVDVYELNNLTYGFNYNDKVEAIIQNIVADILELPKGTLTKGYSPNYDFIIGNSKYELKISSKKNFVCEFAKNDGTPSGISLTESDYYIVISPGWTKLYGEAFKLRIIPTKYLLEYPRNTIIEYSNTLNYEVNFKSTLINDMLMLEFPKHSYHEFDTDNYVVNSYFLNHFKSNFR